jgi:hypothetical protein
MKTVKDFVDEAFANKFKVEALDSGIYIIDYPLSYQEGTRFQRVFVRDRNDDPTKKQSYFINSYICDITPAIDLAQVLREANFGRLTTPCIKKISDEKGGEKESLYTQTTIPCNYINDDYKEFMAIVFECAANADYLEKLFLKEDIS